MTDETRERTEYLVGSQHTPQHLLRYEHTWLVCPQLKQSPSSVLTLLHWLAVCPKPRHAKQICVVVVVKQSGVCRYASTHLVLSTTLCAGGVTRVTSSLITLARSLLIIPLELFLVVMLALSTSLSLVWFAHDCWYVRVRGVFCRLRFFLSPEFSHRKVWRIFFFDETAAVINKQLWVQVNVWSWRRECKRERAEQPLKSLLPLNHQRSNVHASPGVRRRMWMHLTTTTNRLLRPKNTNGESYLRKLSVPWDWAHATTTTVWDSLRHFHSCAWQSDTVCLRTLYWYRLFGCSSQVKTYDHHTRRFACPCRCNSKCFWVRARVRVRLLGCRLWINSCFTRSEA